MAERTRPLLPDPRGPLSRAAIELLGGDERPLPMECALTPEACLDDDDFQLALYVAYELHYESFQGVDDELEWDPALLRWRRSLEKHFEQGIRNELGALPEVEPEGVGDLLFELSEADDGPSLSRYLETQGTLEEFREFVIHRSAYQLKEADPHTWAIPRLRGGPKAALVEVQADEYGSGRQGRMHSELFAKAMRALDLDSSPGAYLDVIPGVTLATVNLISLFGLHRRLRGALVGQLAMFEITSPVPNRRYGNALRRLGADDPDATDFYDEHVEADSVHENIAAHDLAGGLARDEPSLVPDILLGARALLMLEARWSEHLLGRWSEDESSLLAGDAAVVAA